MPAIFMPHSVEILPITKEFQVQASSSGFNPSDAVVNKAGAIWNSVLENQGSKLFDGLILCATTVNPAVVTCTAVPYRFFFAQRQSKELRDILQLRPVAVSGITMHGPLIYFGRRSSTVTQYPQLIELVPSGSLNASCIVNGLADFRLQLKEELLEELGFDRFSISDIDPLFLTFDYKELTYDVYCRIVLKSNAKIAGASTSVCEYEEIFSLDLSEITHLISAESERLVPSTLAVLKHQLQHLQDEA